MQSPLPVLALLCNALLWGLSWWPFRSMHAAGLHPLWATAVMYTLVCAVMLAARPGSLGDLLGDQAAEILGATGDQGDFAPNGMISHEMLLACDGISRRHPTTEWASATRHV